MAEAGHRIGELLAYLDATRGKLVQAARGLNPAFATVKPRDDAWSAAEILTHLAAVERGVARMMGRSMEWARANGIGPAISDDSVMASLDGFSVAEAVSTSAAPDIVVPHPDVPIEDSLASLERSRDKLRQALLAGADLDLTRVSRNHHTMGELNMYQWALFVAQHEERHRKQIERTMREVTERAAQCAPIV